jgi:hypothetical protein
MATIAFIDWQTMLLKYGIVDKKDIKAKLDVIKQEPKQQVKGYYNIMEKLFTRGKFEDVKHRKKVFSWLYFKIRKLCVM